MLTTFYAFFKKENKLALLSVINVESEFFLSLMFLTPELCCEWFTLEETHWKSKLDGTLENFSFTPLKKKIK